MQQWFLWSAVLSWITATILHCRHLTLGSALLEVSMLDPQHPDLDTLYVLYLVNVSVGHAHALLCGTGDCCQLHAGNPWVILVQVG